MPMRPLRGQVPREPPPLRPVRPARAGAEPCGPAGWRDSSGETGVRASCGVPTVAKPISLETHGPCRRLLSTNPGIMNLRSKQLRQPFFLAVALAVLAAPLGAHPAAPRPTGAEATLQNITHYHPRSSQ